MEPRNPIVSYAFDPHLRDGEYFPALPHPEQESLLESDATLSGVIWSYKHEARFAFEDEFWGGWIVVALLASGEWMCFGVVTFPYDLGDIALGPCSLPITRTRLDALLAEARRIRNADEPLAHRMYSFHRGSLASSLTKAVRWISEEETSVVLLLRGIHESLEGSSAPGSGRALERFAEDIPLDLLGVDSQLDREQDEEPGFGVLPLPRSSTVEEPFLHEFGANEIVWQEDEKEVKEEFKTLLESEMSDTPYVRYLGQGYGGFRSLSESKAQIRFFDTSVQEQRDAIGTYFRRTGSSVSLSLMPEGEWRLEIFHYGSAFRSFCVSKLADTGLPASWWLRRLDWAVSGNGGLAAILSLAARLKSEAATEASPFPALPAQAAAS